MAFCQFKNCIIEFWLVMWVSGDLKASGWGLVRATAVAAIARERGP